MGWWLSLSSLETPFPPLYFSQNDSRKRPHYLLTSLAIADLVVGLLAVPLYIIVADPGQKLLPRALYDCVDMFAGKSSMFTLAAISLERLHAIARPLRHRQVTLGHYTIAIVTPWILSFMVASTRVLLHFSVLTKKEFVIVVTISLSAPLLTTCFAYCLIWRKQSSSIHNNEMRARNDARLLRTSLIITVAFVFSWLPFEILTIVASLCISCQKHSFLLVIYPIKLLQYSNSFINFVIYCLRMPEFKRTLSKMLPSCKFIQGRCQVPYPLIDHGTGVALVSFASLRRWAIFKKKGKMTLNLKLDNITQHKEEEKFVYLPCNWLLAIEIYIYGLHEFFTFHCLTRNILISCFDTVFRRPYRRFSIALKAILTLSDKIFTSDWLWISRALVLLLKIRPQELSVVFSK